MFRKCTIIPVLLTLAVAQPAQSQTNERRLLATSVGAVAGVAGGGYIALSIIVAESRMGRYVHDINDILGWRSAPVLIGAATGGSLGAFSPSRLEGAVLYGAAGVGVGALVGLGVGSLIWDPPEGRWAGAAIGAGVGLIIGNTLGVLYPLRSDDDDADNGAGARQASGVPIIFRVRF